MITSTGEYNIPIGTELILSIFDLHRLPRLWGSNANKFDPSHFLPENVAERTPHSFVPFAFGVRNCIGKDNFRIDSNFANKIYRRLTLC